MIGDSLTKSCHFSNRIVGHGRLQRPRFEDTLQEPGRSGGDSLQPALRDKSTQGQLRRESGEPEARLHHGPWMLEDPGCVQHGSDA